MSVKNQRIKKTTVCACVLFALTGCSNQSAISEQTKAVELPSNWHSPISLHTSPEQQLGDWNIIVEDTALRKLIAQALMKSPTLIANYNELQIAKEQLNVSKASDFPELKLTTSQSRAKSNNSTPATISNNANINVQLSYEVDLWGKLSAQQQQAKLQFKASEIAFEKTKNELVTNVISAWFNLIEAQKLLVLYKERASNVANNLDIINASYKRGLREALDVYLTQNDVSNEQARIAQQQQTVLERQRALNVLLGQYPSSDNFNDQALELPKLSDELFVNLPASALSASYSIQQKWYNLLASDASLAVAHKQRFPSLSLSASSGDSSDELSNLLNGGSLAWSIAGSLTAPIFNAGRLASLAEQARLNVKKKEQEYLSQLYSEFAAIENQISNHFSLNQQLTHRTKAKENALTAETLSFNQYMKGLVSYSTVLESQRRAFDAQTSVIQLSNQIIQNRLAMYSMLGGSQLTQEFEQKVSAKN